MKNYQMHLLAIASTAVGFGLLAVHAKPDRWSLLHAEQQRQAEVVFEQTLDLRPGGTLSVDVADADVIIETDGRTPTIRVEVEAHDRAWGRTVFERMQLEVRDEQNAVTVTARDPRVTEREWREHRGVGVAVRLTVPRTLDVELKTGDGDIELSSLDGSVRIETGDGDVDVGSLTGPDISIESTDGDLYAVALEAERIHLQTRDGDILARRVAGPLTATTGDGDVSVHLLTPAETTIRTGDGDIDLTTDGRFGLSLDLDGEDVIVPRSLEIDGIKREGRVRGDVNGGGPSIVAATGDGTILMRVGG
ncbi:MAG: DUF4097 domain-containing protein [Gemmatimonadota bacterium]|nr:DUF4097 domain-containing protein [Gemmatimonadota bacterium]